MLFKGLTSIYWVVMAVSSVAPPMLQWVDKRIISNRQCLQTFGSSVVISSTMCGVGWDSNSHTTCNGDSGKCQHRYHVWCDAKHSFLPTGGPLVTEEKGGWTQIGIVSFVSNRGCSSGDPAGYVRTAAFLNWIAINTGIPIRTFWSTSFYRMTVDIIATRQIKTWNSGRIQLNRVNFYLASNAMMEKTHLRCDAFRQKNKTNIHKFHRR